MMENKITSTALASLLAAESGKNKKFCEDFIREFFKITGDSLSLGENVRIKGFGTFKLTEVEPRNGVNVSTGLLQEFGAHTKVVFTPGKEMAAIINSPFEFFDSIEIDDNIPLANIDEFEDTLAVDLGDSDDFTNRSETEFPECDTEDIHQPLSENEIEEEIIEAGSQEEADDDLLTAEAYESSPSEEGHEEEQLDLQPEVEYIYENEPNNNTETEKMGYRQGFFAGAMTSLVICLIIFMLGCFLGWWPVKMDSSKQTIVIEKMEMQQPQETVEPEIEEIGEITPGTTQTQTETPEGTKEKSDSQPKVYDTVSTTRYLTTIAREHYGNFNFWPYIYLENQSFLGHPDRIKPGTKVVVPPLSKYGVDPQSKEAISKAKQIGQEIYAKFQ